MCLNGSTCIINPLRGEAKGSRSGELERDVTRRLESQVLAAMIPEVAGEQDLVCTKNSGVFGVCKRPAQMAHMCHSKVILNGSEIVTCYLLGKEGEAGAGAERENERAACFPGEVRRTPFRDPKLSLSPLLDA